MDREPPAEQHHITVDSYRAADLVENPIEMFSNGAFAAEGAVADLLHGPAGHASRNQVLVILAQGWQVARQNQRKHFVRLKHRSGLRPQISGGRSCFRPGPYSDLLIPIVKTLNDPGTALQSANDEWATRAVRRFKTEALTWWSTLAPRAAPRLHRKREVSPMGWLKKLLGRQETHEQWLEKHPGKSSTKTVPAASDPEAEAATRARMEGEMAEAREKREHSS